MEALGMGMGMMYGICMGYVWDGYGICMALGMGMMGQQYDGYDGPAV